jgi:phosphohistidine phosphatase SixA
MRPLQRTWRAWATCACLAALLASAAVAADAPALSGTALLDALRSGGYVVYFRHASTDFGQNDDRMTGYEDCSVQRNLTDQGRDEARAIGRAITALRIPVGEVVASPFCRTMETARLMFGRATTSAAVRGGPANDDGGRYRELRRILSTPVPAGTNLVVVSHGNPYHAIVGPPYLAEGEAAVIRAGGANGFTVVAHIRKDEWADLERR